jgi:hypothetical protein
MVGRQGNVNKFASYQENVEVEDNSIENTILSQNVVRQTDQLPVKIARTLFQSICKFRNINCNC